MQLFVDVGFQPFGVRLNEQHCCVLDCCRKACAGVGTFCLPRGLHHFVFLAASEELLLLCSLANTWCSLSSQPSLFSRSAVVSPYHCNVYFSGDVIMKAFSMLICHL